MMGAGRGGKKAWASDGEAFPPHVHLAMASCTSTVTTTVTSTQLRFTGWVCAAAPARPGWDLGGHCSPQLLSPTLGLAQPFSVQELTPTC